MILSLGIWNWHLVRSDERNGCVFFFGCVVGGRNFPEFCSPVTRSAPKRRARNSPAARTIARGHGRRTASGGRANRDGYQNDAVSGLSDIFRPSTSLSNAFPTSVCVAVDAGTLASTNRTRWRVFGCVCVGECGIVSKNLCFKDPDKVSGESPRHKKESAGRCYRSCATPGQWCIASAN